MKVSAFWHGPLGTMEQMCIRSYLKQGIAFDLYSYGDAFTDIEHAPPECNLMYAGDIVPQVKLQWFPWASIFSDYFRYALLAAKGGLWVDMDTLCLRPADQWPQTEYLFARDNIDQYYISGFILGAPAHARLTVGACEWIDHLSAADRAALGHMDIGPYLLQRAVPELALNHFVADPFTFDPIPWNKITQVADSAYTLALEEACKKACVIHLRQSIWNESVNSCAGILPDGSKLKTDATYDQNSLWEILKRRYL